MTQTPIFGDLLLRQKGPVLHLGVQLQNGIAHIQPGSAIRITSMEDFSKGQTYRIIRRENVDREGLMDRALELIERNNSYQLLTNNCEHIANYILYGSKTSHQLQACAIGVGAGALITRNQNPWLKLLGVAVTGAAAVCVYNASRDYAA
ncbi:lecithin retinol acyltransferase family protein [Alcanivorax sp.]|uniref:lecithin retinol acyltransferase family protein n=1 Tax=Alcanivorax sp. TaxID=1872427 RepID=UPI0026337CAB|nr:lecithin retinol acyltransferase family protein [Alcanivorax sp.]